MSFQRIKNQDVCGTSIITTQLRQEILLTSRCIGFRCGCCTLARGRTFYPFTSKTTKTYTSPCGVLLSNIYTHRMKLRHLQTRTTSCDEESPTLAPLPRMDKRTIYDPN